MFIYFRNAEKTKKDSEIIRKWRNDPITLKMFYHQTPKKEEEFYNEYINSYFINDDLHPIFALHNGKEVSFIRFNEYTEKIDLQGNVIDIDINIKPEMRGKGLGSAILQKASDYILKNHNIHYITAEIKKINKASIRAFENAGFRFHDEMIKKISDNDQSVEIYRFVKKNKTIEENSERKKIFIIAEAGSNWRMGTEKRDIEMGKILIETAKEAGADAVKFQTYKPETVYVPNAGKSDYLSESGVNDSINEIFKDLSMPYEFLEIFAEYSKKMNIEFMSTPFSVEDAEKINPFVKRHKLASYEITHIRLLTYLAKTGKPLIMSTGGADLEDIEWAVNHFFKSGGTDISILQCTAKYPAPLETVNLNGMVFLHEYFGLPTGLSDHSRNPLSAPMGAAALGAEIIEKHFTLHNKLPGADHNFALTPDELKLMIQNIRKIEKTLGKKSKLSQEEEMELKNYAFRGVQAIKNIKKGDIFKEKDNIDILRPGKKSKGIHPKYIDIINGKKALKDIDLGCGIESEDFSL